MATRDESFTDLQTALVSAVTNVFANLRSDSSSAGAAQAGSSRPWPSDDSDDNDFLPLPKFRRLPYSRKFSMPEIFVVFPRRLYKIFSLILFSFCLS